MAEYKEDISKKLAEKKEQDAKNAKEDAVIEAIIEDAQMEIPDAMIVTQQRQMIDDFAQRLQMQGMNLDMYCQYTGQTPASMLESVKPQALKRIQSRQIMEDLAVSKAADFVRENAKEKKAKAKKAKTEE